MSEAALREARRALARLRRSVEKANRELGAVESALRESEGAAFTAAPYEEAAAGIQLVADLVEAESERLRSKILESDGLSSPVARSTAGRPR